MSCAWGAVGTRGDVPGVEQWRSSGFMEHPRASAKLWAQPKVPNLGVSDPAATTEQERNRKRDPRTRVSRSAWKGLQKS